MRQMDEWICKNPTIGVLTMVDLFKDQGIDINPKRVSRLMRLMGYMAIYPKKHSSQLGESQYIHPYLLRGLSIIMPNQVWVIDITYIAMKKCFMYSTAIIDVYNLKILSWGLSTLYQMIVVWRYLIRRSKDMETLRLSIRIWAHSLQAMNGSLSLSSRVFK